MAEAILGRKGRTEAKTGKVYGYHPDYQTLTIPDLIGAKNAWIVYEGYSTQSSYVTNIFIEDGVIVSATRGGSTAKEYLSLDITNGTVKIISSPTNTTLRFYSTNAYNEIPTNKYKYVVYQ